MKVAVAGKGGVGKTAVAGTLARVLARRGRRVVAIDADAGPDLAVTLGVDAARAASVPTLALGSVAPADEEPLLSAHFEEVLSRHAVPGPDGVELVVMASPRRAGTGCLTEVHAIVRALVRAVPDDADVDCVLDLDPTAETFTRGVARHVDVLLVLVEATRASAATARRTASLAADLGIEHVALVAAKVAGADDVAAAERLAAELGLPLAGAIPLDAAFAAAEATGRSPLDAAADEPAVAAIAHLAGYVSRSPTARGSLGGS